MSTTEDDELNESLRLIAEMVERESKAKLLPTVKSETIVKSESNLNGSQLINLLERLANLVITLWTPEIDAGD